MKYKTLLILSIIAGIFYPLIWIASIIIAIIGFYADRNKIITKKSKKKKR